MVQREQNSRELYFNLENECLPIYIFFHYGLPMQYIP